MGKRLICGALLGLLGLSSLSSPVGAAGEGKNNVSGQLIGHPFKVTRATFNDSSLTLEGEDLVAADPSKGKGKIVIDFGATQKFSNQTYGVPYNSQKARLGKADVKAPKVTYSGLDKDGSVVTRSAVNNSKSDELDYAMELSFSPVAKSNSLSGNLKLQIGTNPVSDIRGAFTAVR